MALEAHPVAGMFPLMSADELGGLVEDIRSHGLREPIWLHPDGRIVDGRNRYRACLEGAVQPRFQTWDGSGSLVDFVLSLNLHRRHLNQSQKAVIALRVEEQCAAEAKGRQGARSDLPEMTQGASNIEAILPQCNGRGPQAREVAAAAVGVSARYMQDAKKVAEEAPEMIPEIESGEMTVSQARQRLPNPRKVLARERAERAVRLAKEGRTAQQIAEELGVSDSSVGNYLKDADQAPQVGDRSAINRLTARATGLALAADQASGAVKNPEAGEVAQWVDDLTQTIRSLSQLRTRIKERNQP